MTADRQVVEQIRRRVGERITQTIADSEMSGGSPIEGENRRMLAHKLIGEELQVIDTAAMTAGRAPIDDTTRDELSRSIINELFALGRIQRYIDDPDITDIAINGFDSVWITKRNGFKFQGEPVADSDAHLIELIQTAARRGRSEHRWDPASPRLDLQLPSGDRLNAIAWVSGRPSISIRRHDFEIHRLKQLIDLGTISEPVFHLLKAMVLARFNIVIAGGTGAGKTTFMRCLINEIPPSERLITVEDSLEVGLEATDGEVTPTGNDADLASNYSPAAFDNVLTTSAIADFDGLPPDLRVPGTPSATCRTDVYDTLADFSNWGSAIDIAGPGVCILSTYPIEQGSYGTISGTSMASPHAAGALALLASTNNPEYADVADLYTAVIEAGNKDWTDDSGDLFHEPLLDVTGFAAKLTAGNGNGGANTSPVVSIAAPDGGVSFTSGTNISFTGSASDAEDGDLTATMEWTSNLDGQIGAGGSFTTSLLSVGTHLITAAVTDSSDSAASDTITITIQSPTDPGTVTLRVTAYKVRGTQYADLIWSGANGNNVDVYRNGSNVTATENDRAYTDSTGQKGGGSATYQVCEADTTTCSGVVTATW